LAEVVAGTESAARLAVHRHLALALGDDEEAGAAGALGRHGRARGKGALAHRARDRLELLLLDAREERNTLQRLDVDSGHAVSMTHRTAREPHYGRARERDRLLAGLAESR